MLFGWFIIGPYSLIKSDLMLQGDHLKFTWSGVMDFGAAWVLKLLIGDFKYR